MTDDREYRKARLAEGAAGLIAAGLLIGGVCGVILGIWHHNWWAIAGGLCALPMGYSLGCILRF